MKDDQQKNELKSSLLFFAFGAVAVLFYFIISESATGEFFRSVGNSWYLLVIGGGLIIASIVRLVAALTGSVKDNPGHADGDAFRCPHCREIIPIALVPLDGSGFACPQCGEWIG